MEIEKPFKCEKCGKSFIKFVVRVKDSASGKWKTKTVHTLKLAKDLESKFKTEAVEGKLFDKKKQGVIQFERYLESAKLNKKSWKDDLSRSSFNAMNQPQLHGSTADSTFPQRVEFLKDFVLKIVSENKNLCP